MQGRSYVDREEYLEETLLSLASLKGLDQLTVYVSQDGTHPGVAALVERLGQTHFKPPMARGFVHWQHPRNPLLGPNQVMQTMINTMTSI